MAVEGVGGSAEATTATDAAAEAAAATDAAAEAATATAWRSSVVRMLQGPSRHG